MIDLIEANWIAFALALAIGLAVAWWLFGRAATPPARSHAPDVLDEGQAPAARNAALVEAPPAAAAFTAPLPDILGGMGEVIAIATQDEIDAAVPQAEDIAEAQPAAAPAAAAEADDLARIKGVGPKLVTLLHGLGVTRFAQIAAWSDDDLARIDAQLGAFAGRAERDNWIEQARLPRRRGCRRVRGEVREGLVDAAQRVTLRSAERRQIGAANRAKSSPVADPAPRSPAHPVPRPANPDSKNGGWPARKARSAGCDNGALHLRHACPAGLAAPHLVGHGQSDDHGLPRVLRV